MAQLVLINGAPGSGKSTVTHRLAQDRSLDLALDVDAVKHALGQWDTNMTTAGYHARRLALAIVAAQLDSGHDVYIGQFLARTEFIEQLQSAAESWSATFVEVILIADKGVLRHRLAHRSVHPGRTEHLVNASLVSPEDLPALVRAMDEMAAKRPTANLVDASGSLDATVESVRRVVAARP